MIISSQISPHFHKTFKSKKPHQIDSGGRGSTKTSKNALKCVYHMIKDPKCNIVCVRRHAGHQRQSSYMEIKRAFRRLGMQEGVHFTSKIKPLQITFLDHGNTIYFGGLDDYESLKGMIPDRDTIKIVWFVEITQLRDQDDIDQVNATFSRGNDDYYIALYEYNPPKNKFHWVNEWTKEKRTQEGYQHTHTTYLTVPKEWVGKQFIDEAERLKRNDEKRYNWIYGGEVIGLEGLIYNFDQFNIIDKLPQHEKITSFDILIDGGHQTSSTIFLCVGLTNYGNVVIYDTYFYSPAEKSVKKAPSDYAHDLNDFYVQMTKELKCSIDEKIIDSAEGGLRNEYFKLYGRRIRAVKKSTNEEMWDNVQELLATGRTYVIDNKNNQIFLIEHKNYSYKEGSIEKKKPEADKTEKEIFKILKDRYYNTHSKSYAEYYADHTCDGFKYGVIMNLRKYNLKR